MKYIVILHKYLVLLNGNELPQVFTETKESMITRIGGFLEEKTTISTGGC